MSHNWSGSPASTDLHMMELPNKQQSNAPAPWSPTGVSIIAFFLPPGGSVLTVWNLQRLGQFDNISARQQILVVMAVFALGFTVLLSVVPIKGGSVPQFDTSAVRLVNFGTAIASYLVQRPRFLSWKNAHKRVRSGSVLSAIGIAVLYTVLWIVPTSIGYAILHLIATGSGVGG